MLFVADGLMVSFVFIKWTDSSLFMTLTALAVLAVRLTLKNRSNSAASMSPIIIVPPTDPEFLNWDNFTFTMMTKMFS